MWVTSLPQQNQVIGIRRRHARGGQATPPLVDSDDEEVLKASQVNGECKVANDHHMQTILSESAGLFRVIKLAYLI